MKRVALEITTDASGDASATSPNSVMGTLRSVAYLPGSIDTGATITVTCEGPVSKTLLVKASAGTSNVTFNPRDLVHKTEDGAALTGTAGGDRVSPVLDGKIKLVVASGGDTKTGKIIVYYED